LALRPLPSYRVQNGQQYIIGHIVHTC
jgi:hypothetical protein